MKPMDNQEFLAQMAQFSALQQTQQLSDRIEGLLFAKDVFRVVQQNKVDETKLADLVRRPPFFVAESQKVSWLKRSD